MAKETAHQIGTPLSSLLGWIAILKMEKVDDKYVAEIEKDVHRLNTIANRFSKIGSVPELKKENIIQITKQAFDYLESRSSKQITFAFSSDKKELFVNLNNELFGWVIENLIKNSSHTCHTIDYFQVITLMMLMSLLSERCQNIVRTCSTF